MLKKNLQEFIPVILKWLPAIERMDSMQKRLRIMLFGAFLLCVLLGGFFAFNHIAGLAHASSKHSPYYSLGAHDGILARGDNSSESAGKDNSSERVEKGNSSRKREKPHNNQKKGQG